MANTKTVFDYPQIMKEWIYEKNEGLNPKKLLETSKKKAWWRCPKGHEYQASIDSRTSFSKCPYCSGKRVLAGFNDLATTNPELLPEWDFEKNATEGIEPTKVMRRSTKRVWWRCVDRHHSFSKSVSTKQVNCDCQRCKYENEIAEDKVRYDDETFNKQHSDIDFEITEDMLLAAKERIFGKLSMK